jgi:hypothetical protein
MVPNFPQLVRYGWLITKSSKGRRPQHRQTNPTNNLDIKKLKAKPITKSPSMIDENLHGRYL